MDETEFKKFEVELVADPRGGPVSHGVGDLMKLLQRPTVAGGRKP